MSLSEMFFGCFLLAVAFWMTKVDHSKMSPLAFLHNNNMFSHYDGRINMLKIFQIPCRKIIKDIHRKKSFILLPFSFRCLYPSQSSKDEKFSVFLQEQQQLRPLKIDLIHSKLHTTQKWNYLLNPEIPIWMCVSIYTDLEFHTK